MSINKVMKHFLDTMRSLCVGLKKKSPRPIPNVYNVKGPNKKKKKLREQNIYIYKKNHKKKKPFCKSTMIPLTSNTELLMTPRVLFFPGNLIIHINVSLSFVIFVIQ